MSGPRFFVRRESTETGRVGWVGPVPESRVDAEVAAWRNAGWLAEKHPVTVETRALVKAWEKARDQRDGR